MKRAVAACAVLAIAGCGGGAAAATSAPGAIPSCTTILGRDGSVSVLRIHETGSAFTGTEDAGFVTAKLSGTVEKGGRFTGWLKAGSVTFRLNGAYTATTVNLKAGGHDTFSTARGCPPG